MAMLVCPCCSRHVRLRDAACPFCGAELSQSRVDGDAPTGRRSRLGIVLASAMAVGLGPCTKPLETHTSTSDAAVAPVAVYGGPPNFQAERLQQELLDELADSGRSPNSAADAGTPSDAHAPLRPPAKKP
jgi:hypothetical protein